MAIDPIARTVIAATPPPSTPRLAPGEVVAERYRVDALLGEGAMGVVYRVEHVHMRKHFALKVLGREWGGTPDALARFEREAVAAGNIAHAHVAQATDFGRLPDGSCFLVLEYVAGCTLRRTLEGGALAPRRAIHIARGVASAMAAAHAMGVIHRDLKPENIMLLHRDGDPDFVKVLDFGIAKVEGGATAGGDRSNRLTLIGAIIGTPQYMAPEQAMGQPVDARADLYAVGVILYEMLAGRCPFGGQGVEVLRQHVLVDAPDLPPAVLRAVDGRVVEVLQRLLAKAPAARFASATDLLAALDRCLAPSDGTEPPASRVKPASGGGSPTQRLSVPDAALTRVTLGSRAAAAAVAVALTQAGRAAMAWPARLAGTLRARRRRQRLRTAALWPSAVFDRFRAWKRRRRLGRVLASPSAVLTRLHARVAPHAPWLTRRSLGASLAAAVALLVLAVVGFAGHARSAPGAHTTMASVQSASRPHRTGTAATASSPAHPAPASSPAPTAKGLPSAPSGSAATSKSAEPHHTGPGGIYVPPPKDWFK